MYSENDPVTNRERERKDIEKEGRKHIFQGHPCCYKEEWIWGGGGGFKAHKRLSQTFTVCVCVFIFGSSSRGVRYVCTASQGLLGLEYAWIVEKRAEKWRKKQKARRFRNPPHFSPSPPAAAKITTKRRGNLPRRKCLMCVVVGPVYIILYPWAHRFGLACVEGGGTFLRGVAAAAANTGHRNINSS